MFIYSVPILKKERRKVQIAAIQLDFKFNLDPPGGFKYYFFAKL